MTSEQIPPPKRDPVRFILLDYNLGLALQGDTNYKKAVPVHIQMFATGTFQINNKLKSNMKELYMQKRFQCV